ncbi:MAG TPA: MarR family transcriptional regulator [Candidatus Bathyarchaeia archaeon]|nr:MarR family transcriptional regulator [Candidatus Bathyarchaeia archaeon]
MNLEESFGFILNNTGRRVTQLLNLHLQPHEITTEQFSLLRRLNEQDGISQKELAKRVGKDQTNITRILDQLERKGLVIRKPNQEDRRSFLAYVTDEGRALDEILVPIEQEVIRKVLADLSEENVRHLKTLLTRIEQKASGLIDSLER